MPKDTEIKDRKLDHIKINLEKDVRSALTSGLEKFHFVHEALPELDLDHIDTSLSLFGKKLSAPILISSMTGGSDEAATINFRLAEAAQEVWLAVLEGLPGFRGESALSTWIYSIARRVVGRYAPHFKYDASRRIFYCSPIWARCN